jgi:uncharacterized protein YcfL
MENNRSTKSISKLQNIKGNLRQKPILVKYLAFSYDSAPLKSRQIISIRVRFVIPITCQQEF